jgi:hypothetical protein
MPGPAFPTPAHEAASLAVRGFFKALPPVEAILLTNSCARGQAVPDSCLDMCVFLHPDQFEAARQDIEVRWQAFYAQEPVFRALENAGRFAEVHLDVIGWEYAPGKRDWLSGPDSFELEIGNHLVYSVPLWERSQVFEQFRSQWLPYYADTLRLQRLEEARKFCQNNLDHIPLYARRGLFFNCFERLQLAVKDFLAGLFIARRVYPIAYDKWIREQLVELLGLPEVYTELTRILTVPSFEAEIFIEKSRRLETLLARQTDPQAR